MSVSSSRPASLAALSALTESLTLRDAEIRVSAMQFRGFAEHFPTPAWLTDGTGQRRWSNAAARAHSSALSTTTQNLDEDRAIITSGAPMQFVHTIATTDWLIMKFPVPVGGEQCVGAIAFDITDLASLLAARGRLRGATG